MFGGGGWVAAYRAELAGAGQGPQAAGYLLPQLSHPYVALRSVVIRWWPEVPGEPQVVVLAVEQSPGQRALCLFISDLERAAVWLARSGRRSGTGKPGMPAWPPRRWDGKAPSRR